MNFGYFEKKDANFLFKNFTISALFYNFLIELLPTININIKELEKYTKFKIQYIADNERVSIIKAYKLWCGIEKLSQRSDIGIVIADYFTLEKAGLIGKLFIHTSNLRESVAIMDRYLSLIINNINKKYVEVDDNVIFYFDIIPRFIIPLSVFECYAKICYNWLKEYTSLNELPIKEINFYKHTPKHIDYYHKNFPNTQVSFDQFTNYIIISKNIFYIPNFRPKYPPYKFILKHVQQMKKDLYTKSTYTQKIINEILITMPDGNNHLQTIAEKLNISASTLKRHLKNENTSFKKLTELIRKKLSYYMLKDNNLSYEEVSYLLGYSEYSPFFRAFKKWYGMTPSEFRNFKKPL
ncbi:helix-turn-helix domain-containing protein [Nautilia lithotrophica]